MVAQYGNAVADQLSSDAVLRRDPYGSSDPLGEQGGRRDSQIRRAPNSSGLYDILDLILDKGIVIDAFVRVSLVGIELLTVDLRIVIASVDTYLRYAEGVERLQVYNRSGAKRLPDMVGSGMKTHALKKGAESIGGALTGRGQDEDDDDDKSDGITGTLGRGVRKLVGSVVGGGSDADEGDDDDREEREEREPARERTNGNRDRAKAGGRR